MALGAEAAARARRAETNCSASPTGKVTKIRAQGPLANDSHGAICLNSIHSMEEGRKMRRRNAPCQLRAQKENRAAYDFQGRARSIEWSGERLAAQGQRRERVKAVPRRVLESKIDQAGASASCALDNGQSTYCEAARVRLRSWLKERYRQANDGRRRTTPQDHPREAPRASKSTRFRAMSCVCSRNEPVTNLHSVMTRYTQRARSRRRRLQSSTCC